MVRKIVSFVVWTVLAMIFVIFAVANRHLVTVSFDPFDSADPSVAATLPLFVVIIVAVALGVIAGGTMTWFRQGRWRRAARRHEADARDVRAQLASLRPGAVPQPPAGRSIPQLPG
jgi:uncharacterized integral membrane protein